MVTVTGSGVAVGVAITVVVMDWVSSIVAVMEGLAMGSAVGDGTRINKPCVGGAVGAGVGEAEDASRQH